MAAYATSISGLSNFTNLSILNVPGNQITELDLTGCSNLEQLYVGANLLQTLDLSPCTNLQEIGAVNNADLVITDIPSLADCFFFSISGCSVPTEMIDSILIALSDNELTGGSAFLDEGNNGVPTLSGTDAAYNLIEYRDWTVYYNS
jgi:Leucine-rich repeat (LRR) protein